MRFSRHRFAAAAAASVVALAVPGAPASAATSDLEPNGGFFVGGPKVDLSTASGEGTQLSPGMFQTTIPADTTQRYIRVHRGEGERLVVTLAGSATWARKPSSTASQRLSLEMTTEDGAHTCVDGSSYLWNNDMPGLLVASVGIGPTATTINADDQAACRAATSYRVSVKRDPADGAAAAMPTQISVSTVPKASGDATKDVTGQDSPMDVSALQADDTVTPGSGFYTATTLQPGGHKVDLTPGRRQFFRVHVGWNQRMSVGVQLPRNGDGYAPGQDLRGETELFTPSLAGTTLGTRSGATGSTAYLYKPSGSGAREPAEMGAYTVPIRYGNTSYGKTTDSAMQAAQWQFAPGWYYVMVTVQPLTGQNLTEKRPIPSVVSVRLQGSATSGPEMAVAQPSGANVSGPGTAGTSPVVWGGALMLGLLATVGVGVVLARRAR